MSPCTCRIVGVYELTFSQLRDRSLLSPKVLHRMRPNEPLRFPVLPWLWPGRVDEFEHLHLGRWCGTTPPDRRALTALPLPGIKVVKRRPRRGLESMESRLWCSI